MKTVEIQNNVEKSPIETIGVSEKDFKTLEVLQYAGGFLRFNMSISTEGGRGKTDKAKLLPFLHTVFMNKDLINSYFNNR